MSKPAAAVPVRRKAVAPKRTTRSNTPAVEVSNTVVAQPEIVAAAPVAAPSFEAIAALAYSYWEARGGQGGSSEQDWLRAEQELSAK